MNNSKKYKIALSGVCHSEEAVERIFDRTINQKKRGFQLTAKRLAAATMALVLLIGGGFGIRHFTDKSDELSVIVAYAGDNGALYFGSKSEQAPFYGIYTAPKSDKAACEAAAKRWQADKTKVLNKMDEDAEKGSYSSYGSGGFGCYNKDGKETAVLYTLSGGEFELNLEDYTDIKLFEVKNESEYGCLEFDYAAQNLSELESFAEEIDAIEDDDEREKAIQKAETEGKLGKLWEHEFKLTGDELRYSQAGGYEIKGRGRYKTNKGYSLYWGASEALGNAIAQNPDFDLTQIKDTITFTVTYNDGTVKTASQKLYFDKEGYMHFD